MKKNLFAVPFLALFLVTGCGIRESSYISSESTNPSSEETVSSSIYSSSAKVVHEITKSLIVKSLPTKTNYYLYDKLDFTGLIVSEVTYTDGNETNREEITDYVLTDINENVLTDEYQILSVPVDNNMDVYVSKEGCKGEYFNLFIEDVSSFMQSISITSDPVTNYSVNETFDSQRLEVYLTTSYKSGKKKNHFTTSIVNYSMSIRNEQDKTVKPASNYVFTEEGEYTLLISYPGDRDTLTVSRHLIVNKDERVKNLKSLPEYTDDTISFSSLTTKMGVTFTNSTKTLDNNDKGYYSPDEVVNEYNIKDYSDRNVFSKHYAPSTGDVPILVVPIITPGDEAKATDENWERIFKAFFGKSNEVGFESVHSYYYRSSNKKLNFRGSVTEYLDPSTLDSTYSSVSNYNTSTIVSLAQLVTTWAEKRYNLDLTKYDTDKDGYLDAIWMVYLKDEDSSTDTFWAFTASNQSNNGTITRPVANTFCWASLHTIYDASEDSPTIQTYTLIHETGHLLGLMDYYSYGDMTYSPTGCIDMMAFNLGDHNAYSKLRLGWITPYIVYGSTASIKIESCLEKDAVFVIPYDSKTYQKNADGKVEFNVFDEYLVLEYYCDKDLNNNDNSDYAVSHVSGEGGRLYHVDARLGKYLGGDNPFVLYSDPDAPFTTEKNSHPFYFISNTDSGSRAEESYLDSAYNKFDEVRWISADKNYLSYWNQANTDSLFKVNDEFKIADYASSFNKSTVDEVEYFMNCQKTFSTSFKIDSIA
jgi:M6 family metalloprotease-like protein